MEPPSPPSLTTVTRRLLFTFDDNYLLPAQVGISSALDHSPEDVGVLVGSVGLSAASRSALEQLTRQRGREFEVVEVSDLVDGLPAGLERFTAAAWARAFLDRFVPDDVGRVVYLDADTYVRASLEPLFDLDLKGLPLAASPDPWEPHHQARGSEFWAATGSAPSAVYFNTGVMVIDPAQWRSLGVSTRVQELVTDPDFPTRSVDQDALNALLWDRCIPLEREWNFAGRWVSIDAGKARIVHFVGDAKPWNVRTPVSLFQREYEALARSIGWRIDPPGEKRLRSLARSIVPVGLLERLRWRFPR